MSLALLRSSAPKTHTRIARHCTALDNPFETELNLRHFHLLLLGPVTGIVSVHRPSDECGAPRAARVRGTLAASPALRLAGLQPRAVSRAMWRGQAAPGDHFGGGAHIGVRGVGVARWRARRGAVPGEGVDVIVVTLE